MAGRRPAADPSVSAERAAAEADAYSAYSAAAARYLDPAAAPAR